MKKEDKINGYSLQRTWFDFVLKNEDKTTPMHTSLYLWIVELNNRLGWITVFGLPTDRAMLASRIKSYKFYKKTLNDLINWGFIKLVAKCHNQYTCNKVALLLNTKAVSRQVPKQFQYNKTIETIKTIKTPETKNLSPAKVDFINSIIQEFQSVFPDYDVTINPGVEIKMVGKLLSIWKKNNPDLNSEDMLRSLKKHFERCKNVPNAWLHNNMSLAIMVSKYNEINAAFRSGPKNKPGNQFAVGNDSNLKPDFTKTLSNDK